MAVPTIVYCVAAAGAGDRDLVAELEALVLGRRDVDHHLAVRLGRPALLVGQRVEAVAAGREGEPRRAVAADPLAVRADDRRLLVGDRPLRGLNPGASWAAAADRR